MAKKAFKVAEIRGVAFSHMSRGGKKKQLHENQKGRNWFKKSSTPTDVMNSASSDSGIDANISRPDLRTFKTSSHTLSRSSRAISPDIITRMQKVLGINASVISAPTILKHDKKISSSHSAPQIPSSDRLINEIMIPTKVDRKIAKRDSMEFARHRRLSKAPQSARDHNTTRRSASMNMATSQRQVRSASMNMATSQRQLRTFDNSIGIRTSQSLCTDQLVSARKSNEIKANVKIPQGMVSIVITDIQGSTSMWEENASAMKDALDIHDKIIRKCYVKQSGYEITTEGDSFQLAFHHPLDAYSFCLDCQQKLFEASWPPTILALENAKFDAGRVMRGLRVRMGIHHGPTTSKVHDVTHRICFDGEGLELAKAMEKASHGGQIITNVGTWRSVSGMAERYLGSPQTLDLGVHELKGKGEINYTKGLVQLVPKRLAFDYFTFRGTKKTTNRAKGRTFPPPKTERQICAAFFDAPYLNNMVTLVFVNTSVSKETLKTPEELKKLSKIIRSLLIRTRPPGYECQEDNGNWMLAFHSLESAILFGLNLIEKLTSIHSVLAHIGIHRGKFTCMGPHVVTGKTSVI